MAMVRVMPALTTGHMSPDAKFLPQIVKRPSPQSDRRTHLVTNSQGAKLNLVVLPKTSPLLIRIATLETKLEKEKENHKRVIQAYQQQIARLLEIVNRLEYQNDELRENREAPEYGCDQVKWAIA
jgi:hypothetical protein